MTYTATVIEIFLSSPSDVLHERNLIRMMADEWNQQRGRSTGTFMSIMTWESMVAPAVGDRVQEVVTSQMGLDYDVYLGIMWTRLGTPTGAADSGTVEEFDLALAQMKSGRNVWIATIFKTSPVDYNRIDPDQIAKVMNFKNRVAEEGGFYREFNDENSLRSVINPLFERVSKFIRSSFSADQPSQIVDHSNNIVVKLRDVALDTAQEEIGLIEIGEQFSIEVGLYTASLQEISARETANTSIIQRCTEELSILISLNSASSESIKPVIHRAANGMKELAIFLENSLDTLEEQSARVARLIEQELTVRLDFTDPLKNAEDIVNGLENLKNGVTWALDHLKVLSAATDSLPRLSAELARSRNRLSKSRLRMIDLFSSFESSITSSLMFFREKAAGIVVIDVSPELSIDGVYTNDLPKRVTRTRSKRTVNKTNGRSRL